MASYYDPNAAIQAIAALGKAAQASRDKELEIERMKAEAELDIERIEAEAELDVERIEAEAKLKKVLFLLPSVRATVDG